MQSRYKSPEALYSQVATYASQGGEWSEDEKVWMMESVRSRSARLLAESAIGFYDYQAWLGCMGSQEREWIKRKTALQELYNNFREPVECLRKSLPHDLGAMDAIDEHPDFLGDGQASVVMRLEFEGESYAVRFAILEHLCAERARLDIEQYADALARCQGLPNVEQIVALSYINCRTVSRLLPGVNGVNLFFLDPVPWRHLLDAVQAMAALYELEVNNDLATRNTLYDPECGFSFLDLHTAMPDARRLYSMTERIQGLQRLITGYYRDKECPSLHLDTHIRLNALDALQVVTEIMMDQKTAQECQASLAEHKKFLRPYINAAEYAKITVAQ